MDKFNEKRKAYMLKQKWFDKKTSKFVKVEDICFGMKSSTDVHFKIDKIWEQQDLDGWNNKYEMYTGEIDVEFSKDSSTWENMKGELTLANTLVRRELGVDVFKLDRLLEHYGYNTIKVYNKRDFENVSKRIELKDFKKILIKK